MRAHLLSLDHIGGYGPGPRTTTKSPSERTADAPAAPETAAAPAAVRTTASSRSFFERIDHWLYRQQQRSVEAYLAQASDTCDLEARIRSLSRPSPNPYF
jgi:hypothetical protein